MIAVFSFSYIPNFYWGLSWYYTICYHDNHWDMNPETSAAFTKPDDDQLLIINKIMMSIKIPVRLTILQKWGSGNYVKQTYLLWEWGTSNGVVSELPTTSVRSSISETDDALRSVKQKLLCFRERKKTQNQNPKTKIQNHQYGQTNSWMLRPNLTSILSWSCYFIGFWPHFCPTLWWLSLVFCIIPNIRVKLGG